MTIFLSNKSRWLFFVSRQRLRLILTQTIFICGASFLNTSQKCAFAKPPTFRYIPMKNKNQHLFHLEITLIINNWDCFYIKKGIFSVLRSSRTTRTEEKNRPKCLGLGGPKPSLSKNGVRTGLFCVKMFMKWCKT